MLRSIFKLLTLLLIIFVLFILYAQSTSRKDLSKKATGIISFKDSAIAEHYFNQSKIRIATYNIGYASGEKNNLGAVLKKKEVFNNLDAIVETLKIINADVVALQEVDFDSKRSHNINQLEYVAKKAGYPFAAYAITWNQHYIPWPYWPPAKHFGQVVSGQAIISRLPIIDHNTFNFEKPKENPFWYNLFYLNRISQNVTLQLDSKSQNQISLIQVHLEAFKKSTRQKQLAILEKWQMNFKNLCCIIGDFNTTPNNLQNFQSEISFKNTHSDGFSTFPSWNPTEKIDHILVNNKTRVLEVGEYMNITASDHLPIWADIEVLGKY